MKRRSRILCSIFGFYLTLALLVPQLSVTLYGHVFRSSALVDNICTPASAQQALDLLLEDGNALANSCGIPHDVFDNVFTSEQMLTDMTAALNSVLNQDGYTPDITQSLNALTENIRAALLQMEDITDLSIYEEDIATFCTQVQRAYEQYINLSLYSRLNTLLLRAERILKPILIISSILSLFCLPFMWILTHNIASFCRELSFSFIATGCLNTVFSVSILISGVLNEIQLSPTYFRDALRSYMRTGVQINTLVGICTLIIGVAMFWLSIRWIGKSKENK